MTISVRPAEPSDPAAWLLYVSAAGYYDRYAGSAERAVRLVEHVYSRGHHTASWDICHVAMDGERLVGVLAGFPIEEGDRRARRFLRMTVPRIPPTHWPAVLRHIRVGARLTPPVEAGAWYVDALAVAPEARGTGVARALLRAADDAARAAGCREIALDTGIENAPARALYDSAGYTAGAVRAAGDAAEALGGSGFVAYRRAL